MQVGSIANRGFIPLVSLKRGRRKKKKEKKKHGFPSPIYISQLIL